MQRRIQATCGLAVTLLLALIGGCASAESESSSATMTTDNVRGRVASALRDSGTFRFEMTNPDPQNPQETVVTSGEIEYASDGEVAAIGFVTDAGTAFRSVGGTAYHRFDDDEFRKLDKDDTKGFVKAWDWAGAIENWPKVDELSIIGEEEIDGVETTKYEVTFGDRTETWWIDDDDRLVKQTGEDVESRLSGFGEPVDITAP